MNEEIEDLQLEIQRFASCLDRDDLFTGLLTYVFICILSLSFSMKVIKFYLDQACPKSSRGPNLAPGQILSSPQPSHEIYNAHILLFG